MRTTGEKESGLFYRVGLGVIASGARRVTDTMFSAAARVLSEFSPALKNADGPLFPPLERPGKSGIAWGWPWELKQCVRGDDHES